jgi:hypothetical protein
MYFDRYVLFDREHHINDDNQQKTKVMVQNRVNLLDYLKYHTDIISLKIHFDLPCVSVKCNKANR